MAALMPAAPVLVAIGSRNPVKLAAAADVVGDLLPGSRIEGVAVDSSVPPQPLTDEQAVRGAMERATLARVARGCPLGIGIESGVARVSGAWYAASWAVVCDAHGGFGRGCSARVELPPAVVDLLHQGADLEEAMLRVSGHRGLGSGGGTMGALTGGRVTRRSAAAQALYFAFVPFLHPVLFPAGSRTA